MENKKCPFCQKEMEKEEIFPLAKRKLDGANPIHTDYNCRTNDHLYSIRYEWNTDKKLCLALRFFESEQDDYDFRGIRVKIDFIKNTSTFSTFKEKDWTPEVTINQACEFDLSDRHKVQSKIGKYILML